VFDLVYYGGFSYQDVIRMPCFERDFYHEKTLEALKSDRKFEAELHGAKLK